MKEYIESLLRYIATAVLALFVTIALLAPASAYESQKVWDYALLILASMACVGLIFAIVYIVSQIVKELKQ